MLNKINEANIKLIIAGFILSFTSPLLFFALVFVFLALGITTHISTNVNQIISPIFIPLLLIIGGRSFYRKLKFTKGYKEYFLSNYYKNIIFRLPNLLMLFWLGELEGNVIGFIFIPVTFLIFIYAGIVIASLKVSFNNFKETHQID